MAILRGLALSVVPMYSLDSCPGNTCGHKLSPTSPDSRAPKPREGTHKGSCLRLIDFGIPELWALEQYRREKGGSHLRVALRVALRLQLHPRHPVFATNPVSHIPFLVQKKITREFPWAHTCCG